MLTRENIVAILVKWVLFAAGIVAMLLYAHWYESHPPPGSLTQQQCIQNQGTVTRTPDGWTCL